MRERIAACPSQIEQHIYPRDPTAAAFACLRDNPATVLLGDARSLVSTKRSRVIVFQLSPDYLEKLRISERKC
jgi:hypothetical protein